MAHKDSKWPKIETAKAFKKQDSDRLCELFENGMENIIKNQVPLKKIITTQKISN